jgi:AraC-like DNA-binding protein
MSDLIRVSALLGYRTLVARLGGDPDTLLRRFHIEPAILQNEENLIPYRSIIHLMEATATVLACPNFGLQLADEQGLDIIGPIALIGLNSPTVGDAMAAMIEHVDFYSPACLVAIDKKTNPRYPRITFDTTVTGEPHRRQTMELAVGVLNRDLQTLTNGQFVAESVLFRHPTTLPQSVYRQHFGTRVLFEQDVNAVVLRPEDLKRPLDNINPHLKGVVVNYVRQASASHPLDISAQVAFLVRRLLPSLGCGLAKVAEHLCMHERTLQRKLKVSGLVFEDIVDSIRRERAEELLKESCLTMVQIATLLGYAEQASLNRSCHRWFGEPPLFVRGKHGMPLATRVGKGTERSERRAIHHLDA